MTAAEKKFIHELDGALGDFPDKQEILLEYEMHLYQLANEESLDGDGEVDNYQTFTERLGTPEDIAGLWKQETAITPKRTQWLFVTFNVCLFIVGSILTFGYNWFQWEWLNAVWRGLAEVSTFILVIYFFFWGLLGYEIGKEFGFRGKKLLTKTFFFSIIPNLILMYLTVFEFIPYKWFQPLLNWQFIMVCIVGTAILYPVSWIGYRWGKKESI